MTVHDFYPNTYKADGRKWFHCTECQVGWWGHPGPCWCCNNIDNVTTGPATMHPIEGPPAERPHLSPRALRVADRTLHEHRPFWARRAGA